MSEWQPIETAPRDGTWFLVLRAITIVGVGEPARANPELLTVRRKKSTPESAGYWESIWYHSIADDHISRSLWAHIDALPLREMWERIENDRLAQGGAPHPLPMPLSETSKDFKTTKSRDDEGG